MIQLETMKNTYRILLLILIGLLLPISISAKDYFKVLDNMNGLPDNTVNCIRQDARGFIWMGTASGLCRYDGLSFNTFKHDPSDAFSLINDNVHKMLPTTGGLWVATDGGMQFYSFADGCFHLCNTTDGPKTYPMKMRIISMVSSGGNVFVTDESGNLYINRGGRTDGWFNVVKHKFNVYAVCGYQKSMLLAASDKGLYLLSSDGRRMISKCPCNMNISFNENIYYSRNTNLVYVGWGIGFQSQVFGVSGRLIEQSKVKAPKNLLDVVDYQQNTVFATDGGGITIQGKSTTNFTPANSNLSGDAIYSLCVDNGNNLWVGSYRAGVNMFNGVKQKFTTLNRSTHALTYDIVTAVVPDGDNIYMGLDGGGLDIYNRSTHVTRSFNTRNSNIAGDNVVSMTKDKDYLWMAIYTKGLARMSLHDNSFSIFSMPIVHGHAGNNVWAICDDGLGHIWVGGPNMVILDKKTERLTVLPGLTDIRCSAIQCRGEYVWISANHGGIYKVNKRTRKIVNHYTTSSAGIRFPPWYATWWARLLWTLIVLCVIIIALKFYLHEIDIKHRVQIVEVQRNTMKRLNEAKMNFYTLVTHELRTPVFLIAAQIEELVEKRTSIVTVPQSYLESMYRNSQKLNRLISRVIDFRKMDAEKMVLNLQRRNVVEFCNNLSEDYESLCNQKDIKFSFACGSSDIQLNFDLDKLETILTNLVSNAFKYTREGGAVSLSLTDRPDDVVFAVTDNGIGIVEKMHEAIFRNFVRTKRGEAENSGDGVGLATVKNLVELHGGEIHVDSETGLGSCFTFNIPKNLKDDNIENEEAEPRTVDEESSGEKEILHPMNPAALHSILIIDDERDTVDLLERNLASDFKVYKAYDGEEGLQVARAELPDIIVCDLMMPRMDGMQFLQTLKNDKMLQHIKVIIFTAKTAEDDMIEAFDSGADAYLTKPISLKYLRTRIDRMVAQNDNAAITSSISKEKKTYNKEEQIFLLRCREIIDDNLKNEDFNIDMLADRLAMSHSSLYKKIKAMTGMSLIEFINDYKIYHAVELMRQGQTNIDAVCEQCGFNDAKNFRQIFKRKMGMSPKQYVQQL
jgi:signal transduction histidine kinase/DNA-binding response OmpR family regulator/ligand-binding sensor domain-containing protein